jgi:KDO2-lipid IV(A) lauroyltransferase
MKTGHYLTYLVLRRVCRGLRYGSVSSRFRLAQRLAGLLYHHFPIRKSVAEENLARAFPDRPREWRERVLRQCYRNFAYNALLFLTLPRSYHQVDVTVSGRDQLDRAAAAGRGVLLVTAHFGTWEFLNPWLADNGYAFVAIARRQKNRGADRLFRELREGSGTHQLYHNAALSRMMAALRAGKILGLVSDQDARRRGVFVDFLGVPASTPKGAAVFHRRVGAPILLAVCRACTPRRFRIEFELLPDQPEETVAAITQSFTTRLERWIRRYPDQYFWFHRRWKTRPPTETAGERQ